MLFGWRVILWLIFAGVPAGLFGQFDLNAYPISVAEGLPSNTVFDIVQDYQGAIWVGHDRGISRYNGLGFQHFSVPGAETALAGIAPWGNDTVFARTFSGEVALINSHRLRMQPQLKRPPPSLPTFYFNHSARVANCVSELYQISADLQAKTLSFHSSSDSVEIFDAILQGDSLLYAYAAVNGITSLIEISLKTGTFSQLLQLKTYGRASVFMLRGLPHVFLYDEMDIFQIKEKKAFAVAKGALDPRIKITRIAAINDSVIAVGSYSGLFLLDEKGALIGQYFHDYQISAIHADEEGNLWLGTLKDGLMVVPSMHLKRLDMSRLDRRAKISSHAFTGRDSAVLGSMDGRIFWLDEGGVTYRSTKLPRNGEIQSFFAASSGKSLWAFCDGLFQIDSKTGKVLDSIALTSTKVIRVHGDALFCGTSRGLFRISGKQQSTYIDQEWILDMEFDTAGNLIVLARGGLYSMNPDKAGSTPQQMKIKGLPKLAGTRLQPLPNGSLALLVPRSGCYLIQGDSAKMIIDLSQAPWAEIIQFTIHEGVFYGASRDRVWVHDGKWRAFDQTKAVLENDIQGVEFRDGKLYVVTPRSLLRIDHFTPLRTAQPRLYVRKAAGSYQFYNGKWSSRHTGNFVQLEIEALPSISSRGEMRVWYNLHGQDSLWRQAELHDGLFRIRLDRLEAGNYQLAVRVENQDGIHSEIWTVGLTVNPPYYATWWFWTLCVTLIAAAVYGILQWRILKEEQKNQSKIAQERLKIQVLSAELKAIRSQMNPHFIFNTLSAIQAKVLAQDGDAAYDDLSTFSKLLRSVLDYSSREYISLEEEMGFLRNYLKLESNRFGEAFQYRVSVDAALEGEWIRIPALITQPFVENALRHGLLHQKGQKQLDISCTGLPGDLLIRIADNGIGREAAAKINAQRTEKHQSFATQAIEQRISYLRQSGGPTITLSIQDLSPGTEVKIRIQDE